MHALSNAQTHLLMTLRNEVFWICLEEKKNLEHFTEFLLFSHLSSKNLGHLVLTWNKRNPVVDFLEMILFHSASFAVNMDSSKQ